MALSAQRDLPRCNRKEFQVFSFLALSASMIEEALILTMEKIHDGQPTWQKLKTQPITNQDSGGLSFNLPMGPIVKDVTLLQKL